MRRGRCDDLEMDVGPSPNDAVTQAALTRCFAELPDYVVLRNGEDLFANLRRGGDVDLLVDDLELAERILLRHFGPPVRIVRSAGVTGYSYDWGHVDLLSTIEWQGARYLRTEAVLRSRRLSAQGRPVPRIAHEALISWLTSLLWGGFFKERYASVIREAVEADGVAFRQALMEVAGKKWGVRLWTAAADGHPETSAAWARSLRLAVWWRACFRSPVRTIRRYFAFVVGELRLRCAPPVPWIAIRSRDGSMKSSFTNGIVDRFATCPYACVKAFDSRSPLVAEAARAEPAADPHERPGLIGSRSRLLLLAADWLVVYWTRLVHLRAKGYILAFDSTSFELGVDSKRYRDQAGPRLARALSWLLPKPDFVFVLDSEPDVLNMRPASHVVLNGSLPLNVLVDQVQRVTRTWMLARSVASLGGVQTPLPTASTAGDGESSDASPV